jgi:hypothetical protein
MNWKDFGDWAFYACTVVTVLFALLYLLFAPWWRTTAGRNIMAVMGSVALAFGYFTWVISQGGLPAGFYPMRALVFTFIAVAIGWRVVIFIRHQFLLRKGKQDVENQR